MGVPDQALFRAVREGDCGVLERLLGDRQGQQLLEARLLTPMLPYFIIISYYFQIFQ